MKRLSPETGKRVQFAIEAQPGSDVFVAGTFNNWNPKASPLKDNPDSGHFKAALHIPKGKHEYKFIVNEVWTMDPNCANWTRNGFGSMNSVLQI